MKNLKKEYEELLEVTGITPDWLQGVAKNIVSVINPEHWDGTGRVPENFSSLNVGRFYSTANPRFFIQVKKDANGAAAYKVSYITGIPGLKSQNESYAFSPLKYGEQGLYDALYRLFYGESTFSSITVEQEIYEIKQRMAELGWEIEEKYFKPEKALEYQISFKRPECLEQIYSEVCKTPANSEKLLQTVKKASFKARKGWKYHKKNAI